MVMLAHGVTDGLPVAVKFLMQMNDAEMLNRFLREGQLLSRIHHPNVLELFDFGQIDGHPYLVMEYLSGGTLRGRLKDRGRLGVEESVKVALDCLAGLAACHAQGVVHRDLKPENVLFSEDGRAKLADLGMARSYSNATLLTQAGVVIGTPMYMSPEQVRGEPAGAAADIYALGLMMFEMLSGRHVIRGTTMSAVLRAHVDGHTDRLDDLVPELPPSLVKAVHLAMSKEISVRPPTAEDFARRLESSLKGPRKAGRPAQQPEGRRVILVALAIALTVVAAIAAPMLSRHRDLASRPPRAAGPSAETLAVPTAGAASPSAARRPATPDRIWIAGGTMKVDDGTGLGEPWEVRISGFWIDRHAVTREQFASFVTATGHVTEAERAGGGFVAHDETSTWAAGASFRLPRGNVHGPDLGPRSPVVQVTWDDAAAYCRFTRSRLPREIEWEFACRDGKDLATGNVREWCADWFCARPGGESTVDPQGPADGTEKVVRGGSSAFPAAAPGCGRRHLALTSTAMSDIGFRTVAEGPAGPRAEER